MWRSHAYELFSTSLRVSSARQGLERDGFAQCFGTPGKQLERVMDRVARTAVIDVLSPLSVLACAIAYWIDMPASETGTAEMLWSST